MSWRKLAVGIATLALILTVGFLYGVVLALDTGATSPGTTADDATVGTQAWSTTDNAKLSDNSYASVSWLCTGVTDTSVKLVVGGVIAGDSKHAGTSLDTSDTYRVYGGASDTWGNVLTPTDINAIDFGVGFSVTGTSCAP